MVGVIANLSVWFALHVLFRKLDPVTLGPAQLLWPDATSFDWRAALIATVAALLVFKLKRGMITTLGIAAGLGVGLSLI